MGGLLYRLKNQAVIIRLDVSEAKDAFKLFETINNRGLRLSATDIIKNFLLGNAAKSDRLRWILREIAGRRYLRSWTTLLSTLFFAST